jgi:hypothetical protein
MVKKYCDICGKALALGGNVANVNTRFEPTLSASAHDGTTHRIHTTLIVAIDNKPAETGELCEPCLIDALIAHCTDLKNNNYRKGVE